MQELLQVVKVLLRLRFLVDKLSRLLLAQVLSNLSHLLDFCRASRHCGCGYDKKVRLETSGMVSPINYAVALEHAGNRNLAFAPCEVHLLYRVVSSHQLLFGHCGLASVRVGPHCC